MKKPVLLIILLVLAVLVVYTSTKAQRQNGLAVRIRIQKVTEDGYFASHVSGGA